jgi:hypothetical protein
MRPGASSSMPLNGVRGHSPAHQVDLHQHVLKPERPDAELLNHSRALGATKTVILPAEGWMRTAQRDGGNDVCAKAAKTHPGEFLLFTNADPQDRNSTATLGAFLKNGAIGIGELKYQVACDGREMRSVYDVAAGPNSLAYAAFWWPIGFALAAVYFVFVSRRYAGKVSIKRDAQGFY